MLIDPTELDLPLLDRVYKEMENPEPKFKRLQEMITTADGCIPITPEYNHTTSGVLKTTHPKTLQYIMMHARYTNPK